jgi:uncharacterized integral membrane protein
VNEPEDRVRTQPTLDGESTLSTSQAGGELDAASPSEPVAATPLSRKPVAERTRTATAFSGVAAGTIVFLALLIFILENTETVKINFFGASGRLSLGVALLLSSVAGALIVAILGAARIAQLRRRARQQSIR